MFVQSIHPWRPLCQEIVENFLQSLYSVGMEAEEGRYRIGELSKRTGVSPELLRAWERRYGLLRPERSSGGFRLYSPADEARVSRMKEHLARGLAAAEAAHLTTQAPESAPGNPGIAELSHQLERALEAFDESSANHVLDTALASLSLDSVIRELLLPFLHELGERWAREEITVAQEHFASNLIRARLLALGRDWGAGYGPRALLASPGGDQHDLGLVLFGLALGRRGWRITFLGADTPLPTILSTATQLKPDAIVLSVSDGKHVEGREDDFRRIADAHRVIVAGRGAAEVASASSAELWGLDPVAAAERLAAEAAMATRG